MTTSTDTLVDFMAQPALGSRPARRRKPRATRVTADELERLLWAHPGTRAERADGHAHATIAGRRYVAELSLDVVA